MICLEGPYHRQVHAAPAGVVYPTAQQKDAAHRAEAYARSTPGGALPMVAFLWVTGLRHLRGATRHEHAPVACVALSADLDFEGTFLTAVHELAHVRDAFARDGSSVEVQEARAMAAEEQARRERWRW